MTSTHLRDAQFIEGLLQRVTGVSDTIMGALSTGGRKTATEVRGATANSTNRLKTLAEYFSATGYGEHARRLLQATQQLYDGERQFRVAGDLITRGGSHGEAWNILISRHPIQ